MAAGEVPHRDFVDVYGPGVHAITGLVIRLFDGDVLAVKLTLAALKSAAVALQFVIARTLVSRPFAVLGALLATVWWGRMSFILNTPYASLYSVPICTLALLLLLRAIRQGSALGYVAAGAVVGTAALFKQSIGLASAYAMALALWAVGLLRDRPVALTEASSRLSVLGFCAAALLPMAPFLGELQPLEYAVHFLPLHLLLGLVVVALLRRGECGALAELLRGRLAPFLLGVAAPLAAAALLYAGWGAADRLWHDMFVLPGLIENYPVPVQIDHPLGLLALVLGAVGVVSGLLLALGAKLRLGVGLGLAGLCVLGLLYARGPAAFADVHPEHAWEGLTAAQSPLIALAAIAFLGRGRREDVPAVLTLVLYQGFMAFLVFPRATQNVFLLQAVTAPLLAFVLYSGYRLAATGPRSAPLRVVAFATVACLPVWWVVPTVAEVVAPQGPRAPTRSPELRGLEGLVLSPLDTLWNQVVPIQRLGQFLATQPRSDAPLLLLSNEHLIHYVTGRPMLFPERQAHLFWAGLGMLGPEQLAELDEAEMLRKLRATPETLVVHSRREAFGNIRASLPRLWEFVQEEYESVGRFGPFELLARRTRPQPSILVYVIDTLRADALGYAGYPLATTPNIDRFASEATVFERAYAPSSWTRASMASILTGTLPTRHLTEDREDVLPSGLVTLAEVLREAGYRTGYITTNPNVGSFFGFGRGFDDLVELYERREAGKVGGYEALTRSDDVTEEAIRWIGSGPAPFLLIVLTVDPHHPYAPPKALVRPPGELPKGDTTARRRDRLRRMYDAEIAFNDGSFGRLIDHLREAELLEDTIVVLTSDHGEEFYEHGRFQHGFTLFEEVLRVPLALRYPAGLGKGARVERPVGTVDLMPTLLDLAGLEAPAGLDGRSMLDTGERPPLYSRLRLEGNHFEALVAPPWKLIVPEDGGEPSLYHLGDDPGEQAPVAAGAEPEARAARDRLLRALADVPGRGRERATHDTLPELSEEARRALETLGYLE